MNMLNMYSFFFWWIKKSKLSPVLCLKYVACNVCLTVEEISRPELVRPMSGCRFKHMILLKTLCSSCQRKNFYSLAICESGYTPDTVLQ